LDFFAHKGGLMARSAPAQQAPRCGSRGDYRYTYREVKRDFYEIHAAIRGALAYPSTGDTCRV